MSLLALYHRLPPGAPRSVAATLRGAYLARWRYGPETDRLTEAALQRDEWSALQWRTWQEERLARLLHRAATRVPYYQQQWAARRAAGDRASWEVLENWPVLDKAPLREHPEAFVADDVRRAAMFEDHTSGTTGTPLRLWWTRPAMRRWYALFEARCRRWYGLDRRARWAIVGGQLVAPAAQRRPPYWVWNAAMRQLYLSAYHLSPAAIPAYVAALRAYRVRYLLGYTSALEALARGAGALAKPPLEVVITNAEGVLDHQRRTIEAGLGCAVRETYGMAEAVAAASECPSGALHLWPDAGVVEVLNRDGNGPGELVATGLVNEDMPLIRYRVGDRVTPGTAQAACACGRSLPQLRSVEGRCDDVLYTADGRAVGRLDPVFKAAGSVREAQIVQETLDRVRVLLVPAPSFQAAHGKAIADAIRRRMGPVDVVVDQVAEIPRSRNGKFRAVVSRLTPEERRALQAQLR